MTAPTRYLSLAAVIAISFATSAMAEVKLELPSFTSSEAFKDDNGFTRIDVSVGTLALKVTVNPPTAEEGFEVTEQSLVVTSSPVGVVVDPITGVEPDRVATITVPDNLRGTPITLTATATFSVQATGGTTSSRSESHPSKPIVIMIDEDAPVITTRVERFPGGGGILHLQLKDTDVDKDSIDAAEAFGVVHNPREKDTQDPVAIPVNLNGPVRYDRRTRTISLAFANLNPGTHTLTISGLKDRFGHVTDNVDNETDIYKVTFNVPGGRLQGPHVEFPRFLRPNGDSDSFNPADRVDTRVVDLYYFEAVAELLR